MRNRIHNGCFNFEESETVLMGFAKFQPKGRIKLLKKVILRADKNLVI